MKKKPVKKVVKKKVVSIKKEEPKVNLNELAIQFVEQRFRIGDSESHIVEQLREGYPDIKDVNVNFIINRASANIASEYARDRATVVSLHVRRYNDDIKRLLDKNFDSITDFFKRRTKEIENLDFILEAMFAKERVLQMHAKDTQIRVFNRLNAKIKERKVSYDLSKLTAPQKLELLILLSRTKKTEDELKSVILRAKEDKGETIDIDHVVVKEKPNVDRIKKINIPELPLMDPIDKLKQSKSSTQNDIMKKIQETLAAKAKEEFKKKGAKI